MKKVLSLLTIFAFLNVSSWAYAPDYSQSGSPASFTGTYAGVLVPTTGPGTAGSTATTAASLGVFAIGIPGTTSGTVISQGAGVIFSSGAGYNLTLTGVFDPASDKLSAVIEGISNFTVTDTFVSGTTVITNTFSIFAEGNLQGIIKPSNSGNKAVTGPGTASAARINGTAQVDLFSTVSDNGPVISGTINFTVSGFQQSATFSTPTLNLNQIGS